MSRPIGDLDSSVEEEADGTGDDELRVVRTGGNAGLFGGIPRPTSAGTVRANQSRDHSTRIIRHTASPTGMMTTGNLPSPYTF